MGKTEQFPTKIRIKTRCLLRAFLLNSVLKGLKSVTKQEKKNQRHPDWKGRNKTISFCR